MKIYFENLKIITLAQVLRYIALLLNAISFVFILVFAIARPQTAAADAFAYLYIATLILNLLNATVTRNGFGSWLIVGYGFGMLLSYGFSMLAGMTYFGNSVNIGGYVVAELMLLAGAALLMADLLMISGTRVKESKKKEVWKAILTAAGAAALVAFSFFTYDAIYNYGYSVVEYSTGRAEFLFAFAAFAILALLLRITLREGSGKLKDKFKKSWAFLLIVAGLAGFTLSNYFIAMNSVVEDVRLADKAFADAFGEDSLETKEGMRVAKYSFADSLFGIETDGIEIQKDVVYFEENGLKLRYDRYTPDDPSAHRSVLVAIHGRGNDKGDLSVPHRNKYFASKGYVVYDLQVGDYREQNTGVDRSYKPQAVDMLPNVDAFFRYATKNNDCGANFGSVFLTGYSMGGSLVLKYGLSYENALAECGVALKGIVPCYPSYSPADEGMDNYLDFVTEDSLPTLMLMGKNDGVVNRDVVWYTEKAYDKAGNPNYAAIEISYSAHGCDSAMTSRANQIFLYYTERFLYRFR